MGVSFDIYIVILLLLFFFLTLCQLSQPRENFLAVTEDFDFWLNFFLTSIPI